MEQAVAKQQSPEDQEQALMAKYEKEYRYRRLTGFRGKMVFGIAVIWALAQLYTAVFGVLPPTIQRAPHVGFAMVLIFLLYPLRESDKSNLIKWYDWICVGLSLAVVVYHLFNFEDLLYRAGAYTKLDYYISLVAVLLVIEACRRVVGNILVGISGAFLLYALSGPIFPGFLQHGGYSVERIVTYAWLSTESILGIPIGVSSTFIFLFLIFASFLRKTKIGDWMTDLAFAVAGGWTGGPAKAAIIASAGHGMISGSSVGNAVAVGTITIPLMKSIGYRKEFAAAVEACASTGGQIMPPIMGAAAFIMTEFTQMPYYKIALAACIPALLYFTGIFVMVHFEARKHGLKGMPKSQLPAGRKLLKEKWFLGLPILGIVYFLTTGHTPMKAAFYGIVLCILSAAVRKDTRLGLRQIFEALEEGARGALPVVMACASAGIIVGVVTLTGLGIKFANGIVFMSQGNLYLTMLFTMLASLILGMGVPTTANYIIQATIAAPALVAIGVPLIAAHMFVFYFGIVADITPPVALAAFATSGIAGSNAFKTGVEATKLGIAAYLVPFIFVAAPTLVLVGVTPGSLAFAVITAVIGMLGVGGGVTGFFVTNGKWWERVILFLSGVAMITPEVVLTLVGFIGLTVIWFVQRRRAAKQISRETAAQIMS